MDKLSELPEKEDIVKTPEEQGVIDQFFPVDKSTRSVQWKKSAAVILAFVVLANPWVDVILCKFPLCDNAITLFCLKVVVFAVCVVAVEMFV